MTWSSVFSRVPRSSMAWAVAKRALFSHILFLSLLICWESLPPVNISFLLLLLVLYLSLLLLVLFSSLLFLSLPLLLSFISFFSFLLFSHLLFAHLLLTHLLHAQLLLVHLLLDILLWIFLPFSPLINNLLLGLRRRWFLVLFLDLFFYCLNWGLLLFSEFFILLSDLRRRLFIDLLGSLLGFLLSFTEDSLMALCIVLHEWNGLFYVGHGLVGAINFS